MTNEEFNKIFDESIKELSSELTEDKIKELLTKNTEIDGYNGIIVNAIMFSMRYSQNLVSKVLRKALVND